MTIDAALLRAQCERTLATTELPSLGRRIQGKVRVASGPWELEERWWTEDRTERDYWDVELEDGALLRIYRDRRSDRWFADGVYD